MDICKDCQYCDIEGDSFLDWICNAVTAVYAHTCVIDGTDVDDRYETCHNVRHARNPKCPYYIDNGQ